MTFQADIFHCDSWKTLFEKNQNFRENFLYKFLHLQAHNIFCTTWTNEKNIYLHNKPEILFFFFFFRNRLRISERSFSWLFSSVIADDNENEKRELLL